MTRAIFRWTSSRKARRIPGISTPPHGKQQPTTSKESPAMGSIKKKRRAKMSKHKHDKRIKLERHKTR